MISRRHFLIQVAGLSLVTAVGTHAFAENASGIVSATALTKVFGNGQRLTGVALEYSEDIEQPKLQATLFTVENRTVTKVYASNTPMPSQAASNGRFVIIELSADDADAPLYIQVKRDVTRKDAKVTVTQVGQVIALSGTKFAPPAAPVANTAVHNLVVDEFKQAEFKDEKSGGTLRYNLFVPKNYDKAKSYPLVLFMHDAGATSDVTDTTLVQGNGAISFAGAGDQAKHESFVLAPQFSVPVVNDNSEATAELDMVVNLIGKLSGDYNIDQTRLYTTGQSGGGMLSIAMNIKYPDLFAASYLVACQWDATLVAPLSTDKLWIVVSEGDAKAFPGQNAITAELEKLGAKISRATWEGTYSPEQFTQAVAALEAEESTIKYVVLKKGTVVPVGQEDSAGANHVNTWRIAYSIDGIRDWLFKQSRQA
jgi:predicted peptidase